MSSSNGSTGKQMAETAEAFGQHLADRARDATESMADAARSASDQFAQSGARAADALDDAAATVRTKADELPGGERVREFAHGAADRLHTTADYVRDVDFNRVIANVETAARNNPGAALLAAAAFGFVVGALLTRD